jgi:hypothetical protein
MKKGFVKNFFSGWIEDGSPEKNATDTGVQNNEEDAQVDVAPAAKTTVTHTPRFSVSPIIVDQPDPKYVQHIEGVLEENNIEGIDYFEFADAVRSIISSGKSQAEAFTLAFSTLKVVDKKLTPALLQSTAQQYVKLITEEKKQFDSECDGIINEARDTAGKQIKEIEAQEKNLNDEEQRLQKRLQEIQVERTQAQTIKSSLESQIVITENEQGTRKAKMATTAQAVVKVIEGDMNLIAAYLINQ